MHQMLGKSDYLLIQNTYFCSTVEEIICFPSLFDCFFNSVKKKKGWWTASLVIRTGVYLFTKTIKKLIFMKIKKPNLPNKTTFAKSVL